MENRILQLFGKLVTLNKAIKLSTAAATVVIGLGMTNPQDARAQSFGPPQVNPLGLTSVSGTDSSFSKPTFADLDGDGDLDMLSGSYDGNFYYYENQGSGSNANFAAPVKNPFGLDSIPGSYSFSYPSFVDLDGDGDMDLISGDYYGDFYYYKNTGTPSAPAYAAPLVNPFGLVRLSPPGNGDDMILPTVVDLDGDGDMDLFTESYYGKLDFYENTGNANAPSFANPVENPFGIDTLVTNSELLFPAFADLDQDGDMDLIFGGYYAGFYYFENSGTANAPAFSTPQPNPFGLVSIPNDYLSIPAFADLDNDGDLDLLSGSGYGNFVLYKNTSNTGIENRSISSYKVYPNPVMDKLNILGAKGISQVEFYGLDGKLLAHQTFNNHTNKVSIDFKQYPNGAYLVKTFFKDGSIKSRLVTKK